MSGVKGRSGRKPLPVALHLARGTFRSDRHGARPTPVVVGAVAPQIDVPPAPKAVLAGLGARGRQFVCDLWVRYDDWTPGNLVVLHEVGGVVDPLADISAALTERDDSETTPDLFPWSRPSAQRVIANEPLLRLQGATRRSLALLLRQLDLRD